MTYECYKPNSFPILNDVTINDYNNKEICKIDQDYIDNIKTKIFSLRNTNYQFLYVLFCIPTNKCNQDIPLIKLGTTKSIKNFINCNGRFYNHHIGFENYNVYLYNIYPIFSKSTESYLHKKFKKYKVRVEYLDLSKGYVHTNETYILSQYFLKQLINEIYKILIEKEIYKIYTNSNNKKCIKLKNY